MPNADNNLDFAKEIVKDVYADGGKPIVKPTGELVGLVPRAIKAALAPLEKWVLQREYNIEETKKLLEEKLKNIPPEAIESPEAHIAVPAIQYISYCMDNAELRDMYANLLASSMNKVVKSGVHPGFVEIIKQLCPDEAKILRFLSAQNIVPTVTLKFLNKDNSGVSIVKNFSNIGELTNCEKPFEINVYFDNLIRLGLLRASPELSALVDKQKYEPLKTHPYFIPYLAHIKNHEVKYIKFDFSEGYMELTEYGKAFCEICVSTDSQSE